MSIFQELASTLLYYYTFKRHKKNGKKTPNKKIPLMPTLIFFPVATVMIWQ
jgi:hypothetical protein